MTAPSGVCVIQMSYSGSPAAIHDGMPLKYSTDMSKTCRPSSRPRISAVASGRHPVQPPDLVVGAPRAPRHLQVVALEQRLEDEAVVTAHRALPRKLAGSLHLASYDSGRGAVRRPRVRPPVRCRRSGSRAFGAVAASYERGRPGYPDEAARWAVGRAPAPSSTWRRHRQADAHARGARLRDDRGRARQRDAGRDRRKTSPSDPGVHRFRGGDPAARAAASTPSWSRRPGTGSTTRAPRRRWRASCGPAGDVAAAVQHPRRARAVGGAVRAGHRASGSGRRRSRSSSTASAAGWGGPVENRRVRARSSGCPSTTSSRWPGSFSFVALAARRGAARGGRDRRGDRTRRRGPGRVVDLPYRLFAARAVVGPGESGRDGAAAAASAAPGFHRRCLRRHQDVSDSPWFLLGVFAIALLDSVIPLVAQRVDGDHRGVAAGSGDQVARPS